MRKYTLTIDNQTVKVEVKSFSSAKAELIVDGKEMVVNVDSVESLFAKAGTKPERVARSASAPRSAPPLVKGPAAAQSGEVIAPIPGAIKEVFIKEGDKVKAGQPILVMEAMKMENQVQSNAEGVVVELKIQVGDTVSQGQVLLIIQ